MSVIFPAMHVSLRPAGFIRRSAALVYDVLLVFGVLVIVTALALALNGGEPVPSTWLRVLYLLTLYGFFTGFWLHGGQTLGMRAWRLRLVGESGRAPTLRTASVRFAAASLSWIACGLGHLWIVVDTRNLAWHDRLSRTYVVHEAHARPSHRAP